MISLSAQLVTALGYLEQAPRSFETRFRGICTPAARGRNWDFRQRFSYHLEATGRNNSGIMTLCAAFSYREAKHILQSMMEIGNNMCANKRCWSKEVVVGSKELPLRAISSCDPPRGYFKAVRSPLLILVWHLLFQLWTTFVLIENNVYNAINCIWKKRVVLFLLQSPSMTGTH